LTVEDNGLGIDEDKRGDLFKIFKRFHPKTSYCSGLVLYMIKKSAEILGGDIKFEQRDGKGSRFTVILPIHIK